jgi:hypothetical protein
VAVAVGGVRELEGDVRVAVEPVAARSVLEQIAGQLRADQAGEELAQDHVLVVPGRGPSRVLEDLVLGGAVLAQAVDEPVVQAQERELDLIHEQVHVVTRVADQRDALLVARQVMTR